MRQLGNPYAAAAPLRAALYHHLGMDPDQPVTESYPIWDEELGDARFTQVVSMAQGAGECPVHTSGEERVEQGRET